MRGAVSGTMRHAIGKGKVALWRLAIVVVLILLLEGASRGGLINPVSFIAPSQMAAGAWHILASGKFNHDIALTLGAAGASIVLGVVFGFLSGVLLFRLPRLLAVLNPLLLSYYAVPIFVIYPMLIVLFGVNRLPLIAIGFLFSVVAMAVNTLNGLQRIPRVFLRAARAHRLGTVEELRRIVIPAALPYVFTGVKMVIVYSFIAVIAGEFVLSGAGFGYQIAFAYNNFDNATMYGLLLTLLVFVGTLNLGLYAAEHRLYQQRVLKEAV
jgi:NitT/TauT family transport system permease protein